MPQLLKNIATTFGVRLVGIAAGVILFPFVVAHVGMTHYGLLLLITSVNGFFALDFGMGVSTLRYVAEAHAREDDEALSELVSTSLAFFLALGVLTASAYGAFLAFAWGGLNIPPTDERLAVGLAVASGLSTFLIGIPLGMFRTVLSGARRYDLSNLLVLAQIVARTVATLVVLTAGFGILAVAIVDLVVTTVGGTASVLACRRLLPGLRVSWRRFKPALLRSMTPYSAQVFLMTASGLVIMQADNVIIGVFMPVAAVTLYAAAFRLYQTCRNLTNALIGPLVPEAAHSNSLGQHERLRSLLLRGTKQANALALLVGVPTVLFARPVLVAWAGPGFAEVAVVAQILVLGFLVNNNHIVASSLLTGTGRIGAFVRYHLLWAGANVLLSVLLIQRWDLLGVALGTTIPVVLLEPLYVRTALRELGVPTARFLGEAVVRPFGLAVAALLPIGLAVLAVDEVDLAGALVLSAGFAAIFVLLFARFGLDQADRSMYARVVGQFPGGLLRGRA